MTTVWRSLTLMSLVSVLCSDAFSPVNIPQNTQRASALRPAFSAIKIPPSTLISLHASRKSPSPSNNSRLSIWKRVQRRLDVLESAGFSRDTVKTAGIFRRAKDLYNPITFLVVALLCGFKWEWCFRNPYYWFGVAFCVKWYRARYVFKIPVWDRQPNWNNIITSKEQEKDLKAFTCNNCGSTIFIAKTREFFFEGNTGIGGLGCFACGAKGKDNFVNTREEILEDVADMDDYFEYERPLDFVTRAERRKLLKEASGDEEAANQLLLERAGGAAPDSPVTDAVIEDAVIEGDVVEDAVVEDAVVENAVVENAVVEETGESKVAASEPDVDVTSEPTPEPKAETPPKPKKTKKASKKTPKTPKAAPADDDMDILDMDDF
jgi:hypothetical protein